LTLREGNLVVTCHHSVAAVFSKSVFYIQSAGCWISGDVPIAKPQLYTNSFFISNCFPSFFLSFLFWFRSSCPSARWLRR